MAADLGDKKGYLVNSYWIPPSPKSFNFILKLISVLTILDSWLHGEELSNKHTLIKKKKERERDGELYENAVRVQNKIEVVINVVHRKKIVSINIPKSQANFKKSGI